jgi:arabinogalactan oligomer/maltooligosaccharide transport system substrate-binding protein
VDNALLNTYLDKTIEAMSWAGTLYGLPASYDFLALIYNKDMVPKPPEDTDELENIARTLKVGDKYGFVVPVKSSYWYFPWLYGFGGTIFAENGDPAINSPAAVRSAEWLVGLSKVHDLMPAVDADTMNTLFVQRRAAMIVQGPWFIVDAVRAGINVGITRLPKVSAENKWPAPLLGVKGYVIFSGSKQKENAFKLIKFLTSDTAGEVFASVAKTFPAMKAVHESPTIRGDPIFQSFLYQAEVGAPMPSDPLMGAVWTSLDTALQKIYMGTPAKQALDEAQAELTRGT